MKKLPSEVSTTETLEGSLHFQAEKVFADNVGKEVWIDRASAPSDSNLLITVSDPHGVHTSWVKSDSIEEVHGNDLVQAPQERVVERQNKWRNLATKTLKVSGFSLIGILLVFSALSMTDVIKARIVLTGSMVPAINPGDIFITLNPKYKIPKLGDVVAYEARTFAGAPVGVFSHRIIAGNRQDGFIVKGDHNPTPDVQHPKIPDILGVGIFVIPYIGKFLTKQALIFMVPIVIGLWIAFDAMKDAPIEE
jgi:signal peptidase I